MTGPRPSRVHIEVVRPDVPPMFDKIAWQALLELLVFAQDGMAPIGETGTATINRAEPQ